MAERMIRLEAIRLFRDGNAYPRVIEAGEEVIVTARTAEIMKRSDPDAFKTVGFVIPKSTVAKGKGDEK